MRRSIRGICLAFLSACAGTAAAQAPSTTLATAPAGLVRVQFDQVREFLDNGAPIPPPGAFEQEYAKVKAAVPPAPPTLADEMAMVRAQMKEVTALQVKQHFAEMARGEVTSLLGNLIGSIPNPLARMVAGRVVSGAEAKVERQAWEKNQREIEQLEQRQAVKTGHKIAMQSLRAIPGLQRVSIWGAWVRIDNPRDHSAIVYKPDLGRYLVIDDAHKLYRIVQGPAPVSAPQPAICDQAWTVTALGARTLAGVPAHAYRATGSASEEGMSWTHTQTLYFWDQPLPRKVLEIATGDATCPADSPVGSRYPQGLLPLYVATQSNMTADSDSPGMPAALLSQLGSESVQWRGHVRMLTDADRALFEPPAGYSQVK